MTNDGRRIIKRDKWLKGQVDFCGKAGGSANSSGCSDEFIRANDGDPISQCRCFTLSNSDSDSGEAKSRNPKDIAATSKVPMIVLPPVPLIHTAQVMRSGSVKYGPANWRDEPIKESVYASALERHLVRYLAGEDVDRDSGAPHLAHIAANCFILMDAIEAGVLTRDLYYSSEDGAEAVERILAQYEKDNKDG